MSTDYARTHTPISPPVSPWDVLARAEPTPIRQPLVEADGGDDGVDVLLRRLVEHSPDALFYYEVLPTPRFRYVSPAIEGVTGRPPEAFLRDGTLGITIVHEEDRHHVARALRSGADASIRVRILHTSGEVRSVEYHNMPMRNAADEVVAVCGSIHDVTGGQDAFASLRMRERYRQALLDAIPDTLLRIGRDGTMVDHVPGEVTSTLRMPVGGRIHLRAVLPASLVDPILELTQAVLRTGTPQQAELRVDVAARTLTYEARCVPFTKDEALMLLRHATTRRPQREEARDDFVLQLKSRNGNAYGLTSRELAVLDLVAEGHADKQIAEALGISTYTVNKHVGNILGKMHAASRTEAGVRAIREDLIA